MHSGKRGKPWASSARVLLALLAVTGLVAATPELTSRRRTVPVIDLHVDLSYQYTYKNRAFATGTGQYKSQSLLRAGVVGVVLPLYIPNDVAPQGPRAADLERSYSRVYDALRGTPPYSLPGCTTTGGVRTWLAFEGSAPLAEHPEDAWQWVARGVRLFGLVHVHDNRVAASSSERSPAARGLTDQGRRVVRAIHEAGGMVDVSHAADAVVDDVVAEAREAGMPVVATHSNARALHVHERNLDDERLRAIASTGGVIGVNFHSPYLGSKQRATIEDVARHIEHMASVAGIAHVALGSDFEGGIRPPLALSKIEQIQRLGEVLRRRGMSAGDVERVLSGNALRLLCGPQGADRR